MNEHIFRPYQDCGCGIRIPTFEEKTRGSVSFSTKCGTNRILILKPVRGQRTSGAVLFSFFNINKDFSQTNLIRGLSVLLLFPHLGHGEQLEVRLGGFVLREDVVKVLLPTLVTSILSLDLPSLLHPPWQKLMHLR